MHRDPIDYDTRIQIAADELDHLHYAAARSKGDSPAAIRAYFGAHRVVELEARYQQALAERKAAAAGDELQGKLSASEIAQAPPTPFAAAIDDPMQREWREPLNVTCQHCGVKFCFSKCLRQP